MFQYASLVYFSMLVLHFSVHWFCIFQYAGPVEESDNSTRSRRSAPDDLIHLLTPHMFTLFVIDSDHQNSGPVLLSKTLVTDRATTLSTQLLYFDPENDTVEFNLVVEPRRGMANLSSDGWLVYEPNPLYFGPDVLTVLLNETGLPYYIEGHAVEEVIKIEVQETPVAPALFLKLDEEIVQEDSPWRAFVGQ